MQRRKCPEHFLFPIQCRWGSQRQESDWHLRAVPQSDWVCLAIKLNQTCSVITLGLSRSNGQLVGYSGGSGIAHKQWLLDLEKSTIQKLKTVRNKRQGQEHTPTDEEATCKEEEGATHQKETCHHQEEPKKRAKKEV